MKLIAIPTQDHSGWHKKIAEVLSMAETMTMVTIENGEPEVQEVLVNPFLTIQGSGPLFTQYLYDRKVSVVIIKDAEPRACEITGSPTYS